MNDEAGAEKAIAAVDGAEIDDRKISVRIADTKPDPHLSLFTRFKKPVMSCKRPRKISVNIISARGKLKIFFLAL